MPAIKNKILPIEITSVASSGLTGTYVLKKTLEQPLAILKIVNNSNQLVEISWDGSADHDVVRANDTFILNAATNSEGPENRSLVPDKTRIYMKGTAGTGNIYIGGFYHPAGRT